MVVSPLTSPLYRDLFTDSDINDLMSDDALLSAMIRFERALAEAEAACGVIPSDIARAIDRSLADFHTDPASLAAGTDAAGVISPVLVKQLREHVGGTAAGYVHFGATSQDVLDTGMVLVLQQVLTRFESGLEDLNECLTTMVDRHRRTVMLGRTRSQQAAPTSFGLKVAGWSAQIRRQHRRLQSLTPELMVLSFAGAVGNLSALGDKGDDVEKELAAILGLGMAEGPWHCARDGMMALAGWTAGCASSLGKIAQDVILLSAGEVGEVREGGAGRGGSSTMPNKANPTRSEAVAALARHVAGLAGTMYHAGMHNHERDGVAWQQEWLALPQILSAAAGALKQCRLMVRELVVDPEAMRRNLDAARGLPLAEMAAFALAQHMPLPEAQALTKKACQAIASSEEHLIDHLAAHCDAPVDWAYLRAADNHLGVNDRFIDRLLAHH